MATQTYRNIQDDVLSLISKSDAITRNRVKRWINLGQKNFVAREVWPFRETTSTLTTVGGTQEYDIKTNLPNIDEQNIISVTTQGGGGQKLTYKPFNQLRALYPDLEATGAAVPRFYYLKAGKIGFWPMPNDAYDIAVDYYALADDMVDDSDESIIPDSYREALTHYALSREHDYNTDPDLAVKAMNEYEKIVTLARGNLLTQPTDDGNFVIQGPDNNWTGLRQDVY